jgi:hypothetical protein
MAISNLTSNSIPSTEVNTKFYNRQKYQIDIVFDNLQGNKFQLNLASLVTLDIEEDSRIWYKKASLVIRNPDNIFEQKITTSAAANQYYKFRNDGRDLVYVSIKAIQDDTIKDTGIKVDYDIWGMSYIFAVYDREEIPGDTSKQKQLKLYLWEFEQQILSETNVQWSTNELLPSTIVPAYATDEQKLILTGNAIKDLLNKSLSNYVSQAFDKEWDIGSSKLFFSTPSNYKAEDTLSYLLKKHVSAQIGSNSGADPCILSRTRFTSQWKLISYSNFFSKAIKSQTLNNGGGTATAGELQREIIRLSVQTGEEDQSFLFNLQQSPFSSNIANTNFVSNVTSYIKNINFVDMSTIDNTSSMVTSPCYSNDIKNKLFKVDFVNNNIENVKNYINTNYSSKLKLYSTPDTLITLNKNKINTHAINNVYSYSPDKISQLAEGRNFMLTAALFYNTAVSFTAPGSVNREAGTFISIEKGKGGIIDEFYNKLLGQWMVYNILHRFSESDYMNEVTALRVHANDNIDIKNNII